MALSGNDARTLSRNLIDTYFRTVRYPYTRHHIDSYDKFLRTDMVSIIKSKNPLLIIKDWGVLGIQPWTSNPLHGTQ